MGCLCDVSAEVLLHACCLLVVGEVQSGVMPHGKVKISNQEGVLTPC